MILSRDDQNAARVSKKLVQAAGGLEASADVTGKSTSQLSRYTSPDCTDSMPITVVRELESVSHGHAGHPHVTRMLAQAQGYGLFKLPVAEAARADWMAHLAALSAEAGELASKLAVALGDQSICPNDIRKGALCEEADDLIRVVVNIRAALSQILDGAA